jgi:hypothetical protein
LGTGAGVVVKHVLDKSYISRFCTRGFAYSAQAFALHTFMGLATTVIFWGFEFSFQRIFKTKEMRYLGGVIGLGIGHLTKCCLDKLYVFRTEVV